MRWTWNAVLWRSLAVPAPEQMVELFWTTAGGTDLVHSSNGSNFPEGSLEVADYCGRLTGTSTPPCA